MYASRAGKRHRTRLRYVRSCRGKKRPSSDLSRFSKSLATRCVRTSSSRRTIQSLSKRVQGIALMQIFDAFSSANTRLIREERFGRRCQKVSLTCSIRFKRGVRVSSIVKHAMSTIALGNGLHASRSVHIIIWRIAPSRRISSSVDSSPEMPSLSVFFTVRQSTPRIRIQESSARVLRLVTTRSLYSYFLRTISRRANFSSFDSFSTRSRGERTYRWFAQKAQHLLDDHVAVIRGGYLGQ